MTTKAERGERVARAAAQRAWARGGYVYFVQAGGGRGPVKIGHSFDAAERIKGLQTGCPEKLRILEEVQGTTLDERRFHDELKRDRLHGEWFRPTPRVAGVILRVRAERMGVRVEDIAHDPALADEALRMVATTTHKDAARRWLRDTVAAMFDSFAQVDGATDRLVRLTPMFRDACAGTYAGLVR